MSPHKRSGCTAWTGVTSWTRLAVAAGALITVVLVESALAEAAVSAKISAQEVIEGFHAELLSVMKSATELGYEGRLKRLTPIVGDTFDTRFMAAKSIGRYWKTISEQEQDRLLATFGRYTVANYAGRFSGYTGEEFQTNGEEPSLQGTTLVHTTLIIPKDDDVRLDYRVRAVDGEWKIIDIYLDGTVSELAMRRSQYSALIRREGLDALIAALEKKMEEFSEDDK